MSQASCVGMLDWGIGGLACYRLLKQAQPRVPVIYWSDTGAVPYGKLSRERLKARVEWVLEQLAARGANCAIVACNAASSVLPELRKPPLPVLGIIEASRHAIPKQLTGTLAVLGGQRTVRSGLHRRLLSRPGLRVVSRVAQPLSGHIEAGSTETRRYQADLTRILGPIGLADGVLLACTHYPAIASDLRERLAASTLLLDPAPALIRLAQRRFGFEPTAGADQFFTTGSARAMREAARRVWSIELPAVRHIASKGPG